MGKYSIRTKTQHGEWVKQQWITQNATTKNTDKFNDYYGSGLLCTINGIKEHPENIALATVIVRLSATWWIFLNWTSIGPGVE